MKKQVLAAILVLALAISLLTGCTVSPKSSGGDNSNPTTSTAGNNATPADNSGGNTAADGWSSEWPSDVPKISGTVEHWQGIMNQGGIATYMQDMSINTVNSYVDTMKSKGYTATPQQADPGVSITQLTNAKYTITVTFDSSNNTTVLWVVNAGDNGDNASAVEPSSNDQPMGVLKNGVFTVGKYSIKAPDGWIAGVGGIGITHDSTMASVTLMVTPVTQGMSLDDYANAAMQAYSGKKLSDVTLGGLAFKKMDYEGGNGAQTMYMAYNGNDQIEITTMGALTGDATADNSAIAACVESFKVN